MRYASLPMYDLTEIRHATQAWWAGLARTFEAAGIEDVPQQLTTPSDTIAHWQDTRTLFSQTCGLPYTRHLAEDVNLVATPCYAAPGCDGPRYRSLLLAGEISSGFDVADMRRAKDALMFVKPSMGR